MRRPQRRSLRTTSRAHEMKSLWMCLHFPDLPLCVFARGDARQRATVVSSVSHRPDVIAANRAAQRRGIVVGLSVAAALALDAELVIHLRDERAESVALRNIALWAGQWTPTLSHRAAGLRALEISGCLNYFGGLERLYSQVEGSLAALGFPAVISTAPTALAASLFARAGQGTAISEITELATPLNALPIKLLADQGLAPAVLDTLAGLGAHTLGDVIALPRDGVARRFGQWLLDEIDRAHGRLPDARALFVAPEHYQGSIELPSPVAETEALLFAAKRLVERTRRVPARPRRRRHPSALRSRARGRLADVDRAGARGDAPRRSRHERAARALVARATTRSGRGDPAHQRRDRAAGGEGR